MNKPKVIKNATRDTIIAKSVELADSFWKKAKGLMFRNELEKESGLLMVFKDEDFVGIWMMFMKFPIDLIYLDSKKHVVGLFENIKPIGLNPKTWRVYYPEDPARYVLELRSGTVKKTGTKMGDILNFR